MVDKEVWKDVVGWEGMYEVSSFGKVKSLNRTYVRTDGLSVNRKGRLLKTPPNKDGYLIAHLTSKMDNKKNTMRVHRLVANAFIYNPMNLPEVNHIDEIKSNNNVKNLEWCNHYDNCHHGTMLDRFLNHSSTSLKWEQSRKPIVGVSLDDGSEIRYGSISEADVNGFPRRNLFSAIKGTDRSCKGYVWFFESDFNQESKDTRMKKIARKVIVQKDNIGNVINTFNDTIEAGKHVNRDCSNISRACNLGRVCAGFKWEYA